MSWFGGGNTLPEAGQMAPDFTLAAHDGRVSLRELRGRWVVLYFYPKDATPGCTVEARNFERDIARYEQHGAMIVGVSTDSTSSHRAFCAKQELTFRLVADIDKAVSKQYGSLTNLFGFKMSARNTFLIDPEGKIAKVWEKVSPGKHSEEVLATLGQLVKI
jgi:peroxiredoxin Q/BCP